MRLFYGRHRGRTVRVLCTEVRKYFRTSDKKQQISLKATILSEFPYNVRKYFRTFESTFVQLCTFVQLYNTWGSMIQYCTSGSTLYVYQFCTFVRTTTFIPEVRVQLYTYHTVDSCTADSCTTVVPIAVLPIVVPLEGIILYVFIL
jgi:hypothetical protein